jgi:lipopolysaccharide/colanic/teichoic acid biosynthesis glycosyltransferase
MAEPGTEGLTSRSGKDRYALPPAPFLNRRRLCPAAEELAARVWPRAWPPRIVAGLSAIADLAAIVLAGFAAALAGGYEIRDVLLGTVLSTGVGIGTVVAFHSAGLYEIRALYSPRIFGLRAAAAWSAVCATCLFMTLAVARGLVPDPSWWGAFLVAASAALGAVKLAQAAILAAALPRGLLERRTVLVGGGPPAQAILRALRAGPSGDVRVLGYFDDRDDSRVPDSLPGCPKLGDTDDLVEFVRRVPVDLVLFTLPFTAEDRILDMLRKLWLLPVDIRLAAHQSRLRLRARCYSRVGGIPVVDLADRPVADWDAVLKTAFDRAGGAVLLLLLAPVMLMVACVLRLSGTGPVLVREQRYGFNNEIIEVLRFREPVPPPATAGASREPRLEAQRTLAILMRRTGIASLPQLVNVVFGGKLSLVGPAPHPPEPRAAVQGCDDVVDGYFARHKVKPGITGWAQIAGLDGLEEPVSVQRRIESDLYYIENWSILLDLYILAMTPFARSRPRAE